ncbi:MAG: acyl carrier protein [Desulfovibrionaceae bacterium]|nr:acyl carrier protein [Desulfovibrionaceae bacterium]
MISGLRLEDVTPEMIQGDTVLFGRDEGLRLDSLDAVELVTIIKSEFGVSIEDADEARRAFTTLSTLVAYIAERCDT